jgi:hypothetical protein
MELVTTNNRVIDNFTLSKGEIFETALAFPFVTLQKLGGLNLYEFIQVFWNEVVQDEFKTNWHIEYLCTELETVAYRVGNHEDKEYDLIINIPPGTSKTLICSIFFPVWCWTKWSWIKFITGSYSDALAMENAEKSRDVMRSDKFKLLYPNIIIKEDKDTKSNYRIAEIQRDKTGKRIGTIFGGGRFSTSVGGTITGFHGHINIWDDPINPKQAVSEVLLKTANNWVDQSASTRKADKNITVTVLIMQRLHQEDPSGHILEKEGKKVRHICLPGEIRSYRDNVSQSELINRYVDDLLDPVRLNWTALTEMEADLGQYGYSGQIGQSPSPPGGGMFKVDNFQIIQSMPSDVHVVQWVRYWDKAGTKDGGCFTAGVKIAKLKNNRFIIVDVRKDNGKLKNRKNNEILQSLMGIMLKLD